jgi:HSP20 family protein
MLMRFDPFRELDRVVQSASPTRPVMPLDAFRHNHDFIVNIDLPGVEPGSIEVTVDKDVLTVEAERMWSPIEGDEVLVTERPQGKFARRLFLGEALDTEQIAADYENGVLRLTIPVAESAKPRKVEVAHHASPADSRQLVDVGAQS